MPDLQKLNMDKERIISTIRLRGPSFPTRISREVQISPLFVAALLSELVSEKRLKISNMKVGSSPIYYLVGQEQQLENFSEYLNHKEREAFDLLKKSQILEDGKQEPAIRVALRAIKDFAIPINLRVRGEAKLIWKQSSVPDAEAQKAIQNIFSEKQIQKPHEAKREILERPEEPKKETPETLQETPETPETPQLTQSLQEPRKVTQFHQPIIQTHIPTQKIKKQLNPKKENEFPILVKKYLTERDIEILEEISNKKREFTSKIRADTPFGKQEFFLMAKDKKKVTQNDLTIALQSAQTEKMPAFFLSPGEPDKNAKLYLETWRNLIKFEKIKP